jgi:hypothetical protein
VTTDAKVRVTSITAGSAFTLPDVGTPGSYQNPVSITTDAKGRVTSVSVATFSARKALYVDCTVSASGDGSLTSPYKTITEGLAAVTSAYTAVYAAPCVYNESLTWPNYDDVALIGAGSGLTVVVGTSGAATLSWAPGAATTFGAMTVRNLTLRQDNAQDVINLSGAATFTLVSGAKITHFMTRWARFENVAAEKTVSGRLAYMQNVDKLIVSSTGPTTNISGNASGWKGTFYIDNSGYVMINNTIIGNGIDDAIYYVHDYTISLTQPEGGRQGVYLLGGSSVYGAVRLRSAPYFVMATDSAIYNGPLDATSLAIFTAPFRGPTVILRGTLGNAAAAVPITFTCPSTSVIAATNGAICWFDGSDATFWGTPSTGVALFQGTAATPVRFAPFTHGAKWKRVGLATTGVTVTAGESTDLDIRFSDSYADNQLSVNTNGTVDRDSVEISAAASPGSGTYGVPFPSGASLFVAGTPTGTTSVGGFSGERDGIYADQWVGDDV